MEKRLKCATTIGHRSGSVLPCELSAHHYRHSVDAAGLGGGRRSSRWIRAARGRRRRPRPSGPSREAPTIDWRLVFDFSVSAGLITVATARGGARCVNPMSAKVGSTGTGTCRPAAGSRACSAPDSWPPRRARGPPPSPGDTPGRSALGVPGHSDRDLVQDPGGVPVSTILRAASQPSCGRVRWLGFSWFQRGEEVTRCFGGRGQQHQRCGVAAAQAQPPERSGSHTTRVLRGPRGPRRGADQALGSRGLAGQLGQSGQVLSPSSPRLWSSSSKHANRTSRQHRAGAGQRGAATRSAEHAGSHSRPSSAAGVNREAASKRDLMRRPGLLRWGCRPARSGGDRRRDSRLRGHDS